MWNRNELHDVRVGLFGGEGAVRVWNLPLGATSALGAAPFVCALACELEPAGRVGVHVQQEAAELVLVLEGEGVAIVDGVPRLIEAGSVTALPLGATLAIDNGSPHEPLRYLVVKALPPA